MRRVWCCGDVRAVVLKNEDGAAWGRIVRCGAAVAALEDLTGDERVRGRWAWVCDDVDVTCGVTCDVTTMRALRENILRCERARVLLLRRVVARGAELGDVETWSGVYPWIGQGMGLAAAYRELLSYRLSCCGALDMRWGAMGAITSRATAATGAVAVVWSTLTCDVILSLRRSVLSRRWRVHPVRSY